MLGAEVWIGLHSLLNPVGLVVWLCFAVKVTCKTNKSALVGYELAALLRNKIEVVSRLSC